MTDVELSEFLEDIDLWVRGGRTVDDAIKRFAKVLPDASAREQLKREYLKRNQRFIELTDPRVLKDNAHIETWYSGPDSPSAWCWPAFKKAIAPKFGKDFALTDEASTKIMAHLPHPGRERFVTRGLAVGYVQSGKTANYSALISKAADVGYRLFIVLAGSTSSLRRQTQERLETDVCRHHPQRWFRLTTIENDFGHYQGLPSALLSPDNLNNRILCVVKKNRFILDRLRNFLMTATPDVLKACPALIIDDEADNASINTASGAERTAINNGIIGVLNLLPRAAYVAYTATPFANIFIDPSAPEDLFPRNFIVALKRPSAYFGTERIFGRELLWYDEEGASFDGLDITHLIPVAEPDETALVRPAKGSERDRFQPQVPSSLARAIRYFVLATACRYARGDLQKHSSMLVHTSHFVTVHRKLEAIINEHLDGMRATWTKELPELEKLWNEEMHKTQAVVQAELSTRFQDLVPHMPEALRRCQVIVDNGRPGSSKLIYPDEKVDPKVYIAIGGNTLSRGLTLEGLVVSYFVRTASAYDTLLQMGRWFGYRPRFEDLPRIWLTAELEQDFLFLAGVEEELRRDINRMEAEGRTPREFAIRVRTHPKLSITAPNKMGRAHLESASFSEKRVQSFLFKHQDRLWLEENFAAASELLGAAEHSATRVEETNGRWGFRGVDVNLVRAFIRRYRFHEKHEDLEERLLLRYIDAEVARGSLRTWNVFVVGHSSGAPDLGTMDFGVGTASCINRSRFKMTEPCNIKALTSRADRIIDIPEADAGASDEEMIELRNRVAPETGLLLLYPISKNSTPEKGDEQHCNICHRRHRVPGTDQAVRHPLGAVEHVLGAALVFPKSKNPEADYMANNLAEVFAADQEEVEAEREVAVPTEDLER